MSPAPGSIAYPRTCELTKSGLPLKTLDTGMIGLGVHVSANAWGNVLQINSTHKEHGVIAATAFSPFKGDLCESEQIREYRKTLLSDGVLKTATAGFGVVLQNLKTIGDVTFEHFPATDDQTEAVRSVYLCENDITVINTIIVTAEGEVRQVRHITTSKDSTLPFEVKWALNIGQKGPGNEGPDNGQCHLGRATYGQLTEGGMHEMPVVQCSSGGDLSNFYVSGDEPNGKGTSKRFAQILGAVEVVHGKKTKPWKSLEKSLGETRSEPLTKDSPITITARFQFRGAGDKFHKMPALSELWNSGSLVKSLTTPFEMDIANYIVWRNVDYVLDNCCIEVRSNLEKGAVSPICVITDHVALPLGWNRDNYWQLRPLMQLRGAPRESIAGTLGAWYTPGLYEPKIDKALFGHLNWVFRQAKLHRTKVGEELKIYKKPDKKSIPHTRKETKAKTGFWARSYFYFGKTKDSSGIFQLDQQCYPFLELCDFWETYATLPKREEARKLVTSILNEPRVAQILELLINEIGDLGLIHTDETPGDDEVKFGHLFSCNLLVWYTFKRLSKLLATKGFENQSLKSLKMEQKAQDIREAMLRHFKTSVLLEGFQRTVFAYDCGIHERGKPEMKGDTEIKYVIYADGNDVPTLMSKQWDFLTIKSEEDIWQNTMDWMFDPVANMAVEKAHVGTYWSGKEGEVVSGLGSKHSPKPWPLGIYQEWRYFTMRGDTEKAQKAWRMILKCQQWDGTFSETVDMKTAACDSKAWFSWPGAMIASAIIDDKLPKVIIDDNLEVA